MFRMAESQSFDLSTYDYDPSSPIPSNRDARNYVISKGPCQPKDFTFPRNSNGRRFLTAWYENFKWLEYSKTDRQTDRAFCFFYRTFNRQVRYFIPTVTGPMWTVTAYILHVSF